MSREQIEASGLFKWDAKSRRYRECGAGARPVMTYTTAAAEAVLEDWLRRQVRKAERTVEGK